MLMRIIPSIMRFRGSLCFGKFFGTNAASRQPSPELKEPPAVVDLTAVAKAGYTIAGLNVFAGKSDPVIKEPSEYPSWIWEVLEEPRLKEIALIQDPTDDAIIKKQAKYARKLLIRENNQARAKKKNKK